MQQFEDQTDLEEWLEALDYESFWKAANPYGMCDEDRASCDLSISRGVDQDMILGCIKAQLRLKILGEQKLKPRYYRGAPAMH